MDLSAQSQDTSSRGAKCGTGRVVLGRLAWGAFAAVRSARSFPAAATPRTPREWRSLYEREHARAEDPTAQSTVRMHRSAIVVLIVAGVLFSGLAALAGAAEPSWGPAPEPEFHRLLRNLVREQKTGTNGITLHAELFWQASVRG